jgi:hypothetical protein
MALLRRRTSELLSLALVSCLVIGLVGGILVAIRDPYGSLRVVLLALAVAAALSHSLGEGLIGLAVYGPVFAVLALGLYALFVLCHLPLIAVLWIGGVLGVLVLVILARALIAAGSADYPYDE